MICVRKEGLLAGGVRRIMNLDSNQAGQHRPSGGGGLGEDSDWRMGACRKPKSEPSTALTLRLSIAKGSVNCEAATVMLWNYSIRLYSTVSSTNTCFSPKAATQGQARTDTQTRTHRNNLYNDCSLINIQRWQPWLTFELPSLTEGLNWPCTSSLRQ